MFKNKILLKATQSSSPSSFFLLPLSLPPSSSTTDPPLSVEIEILSWKLSRKWRLACLTQPFEILVVYKKSQADLVDRVVSEFVKFDPAIRIGVEEELQSGSVIAKALEIALRCVMLDHKWTCVGDKTFVKSTFNTSEERANVYAVNVQVQSGASDEVIFVVSPETLRFSRHQILDLLRSENVDKFEKKGEVILESSNFSTACTILPSLYEGYVVGVSKVLPEGESVDNLQDLWSIKHGLTLKSKYYIAVQFLYGGCLNQKWFPSSFVLQGSGLTPAPKTIRVSKAMLAFESFIRLLEAWDFFGGGSLIVKEQSLIGNGETILTWEKVTDNLPQCIINTGFIRKDPLLALDFRTPKPDIGYFTEENTLDRNKENSLVLTYSDSKDSPSTINEVQIDKRQTPLLVPSFTKTIRKTATKSSAQIRSKGEAAQVRERQENCQSTAKSQKKNENVLVSSPIKCAPKSQSSTGAASADKHVKATQGNTNCASARSVKPTKKNDATTDNKFTADTRIGSSECSREICSNWDTLCEWHKRCEESTQDYPTKAKSKTKLSLDKDEVTTKVLNCHKRGQLQSLTVADLKCFLSCKKAKVGGTKEELIRRVTGLLN